MCCVYIRIHYMWAIWPGAFHGDPTIPNLQFQFHLAFLRKSDQAIWLGKVHIKLVPLTFDQNYMESRWNLERRRGKGNVRQTCINERRWAKNIFRYNRGCWERICLIIEALKTNGFSELHWNDVCTCSLCMLSFHYLFEKHGAQHLLSTLLH